MQKAGKREDTFAHVPGKRLTGLKAFDRRILDGLLAVIAAFQLSQEIECFIDCAHLHAGHSACFVKFPKKEKIVKIRRGLQFASNV